MTLGKYTRRYHANGLPQTLRRAVVAVVGVGRRYLEALEVQLELHGGRRLVVPHVQQVQGTVFDLQPSVDILGKFVRFLRKIFYLLWCCAEGT